MNRHTIAMRWLAIFTFAVNMLFPVAASELIIKDVTLIDREDPARDVMVSLIIQDGVLDLVTRDEVAGEDGAQVFDASGGYLLGELTIGSPPSFLILDANPRVRFEILLDTQTYTSFAMRRGEVVKNSLPLATSGDPKPEKEWLAYSPPPFALPADYRNRKKWNRFDTGPVSGLFAGAIMLDRQHWLSQDENSESQVGQLASFEGGEMRALRFGFVGTFNFAKPWVYTLYVANNAFAKGFDSQTRDGLSIFDLRIDIPLPRGTTLSVGKQKEPISHERLSTGAFLPTFERSSAADSLLPSRNIGLVYSGTAFKSRSTWAAGVFNNWLDDDGSRSENAAQFVGRGTWLPYVSQDEASLMHLGVGYRYSDAEEGMRFRSQPEFNQSPTFVDTGVHSANSFSTWNLEAGWRSGPFWLMGEYLLTATDAPGLSDPSFDGYHLTASWIPTGEMRPYRRKNGVFANIPVARPTSAGGLGTWELVSRYSHVDLTDGPVLGGEMDIASLGVNWWLTRSSEFSMYYRRITLDDGNVEGDSGGLLFRLTLILD